MHGLSPEQPSLPFPLTKRDPQFRGARGSSEAPRAGRDAGPAPGAFDLPRARALIFSLTQGSFPLRGCTQLPVLTRFLFAAPQAGCRQGPSRGSPSPKPPGSQSKAPLVPSGRDVPILPVFPTGWPALGGIWGGGEKHQKTSKSYFKSPNTPNYKTGHKPWIIMSYQRQNRPATPPSRGSLAWGFGDLPHHAAHTNVSFLRLLPEFLTPL